MHPIQSPFTQALNCVRPERVPFIPAIYEHKAWFVGATPSAVCKDPDLFYRAIIAEYESVRPDALVVGIDVYNVEAEALGCSVMYHSGNDNSIPAIPADGHLQFGGAGSTGGLKIPNPLRDGRMPLHLDVAGRVVRSLGTDVPVRGALSGPFSLAISLFGTENMFITAMSDPDAMREILRFCTDVIREYGKAYIDRGCGVVIFDSQATPELISPEMYCDLIQPFHRELVRWFISSGLEHVPLIIGGNTTPILSEYIGTGANNILCDSQADHVKFLEACTKAGRAFRRNIRTTGFLSDSPDSLYDIALEYLNESNSFPGFILGTGVVPYGTPVGLLQAIRRAVVDWSAGRQHAQ
jgi:uroporphyrinogen decarboxylase